MHCIGEVEGVLQDKSKNALRAWWGSLDGEDPIIDSWRDNEKSSVKLTSEPGLRTLVYFKD